MLKKIRIWAYQIKLDTYALYLAAHDPRVPWYAKALAIFVASYALSPIDLIPDFIPLIGYLDDLVLVPLGIWMAIRLIPPQIMSEHRAAARNVAAKPVSRAAAGFIICIWVLLLIWLGTKIAFSMGSDL
ncbi:MAG: DUF1232 domain-containing protein [Alphaproteobacteria bacterium]|nr:DUF1232 domain-containing protein [Alphaproteobacteria bacterium]